MKKVFSEKLSGMFFKLFFGIWFTALLTSFFLGLWGYFFHYKPDRARFAEMGKSFLQVHGESLVEVYETNGIDQVKLFEPPGILVLFDADKKLIFKMDKHPGGQGNRRGAWRKATEKWKTPPFPPKSPPDDTLLPPEPPFPNGRFSDINWETPETFSFLNSLESGEASFLDIAGRTFIGAKIQGKSGNYYYILKGLPGEFDMRHRLFLRTVFMIVPVFILTTSVLCFLLTRSFLRPVSDLQRVSREFAGGNLSARPEQKELERTDEIGALTRDFNLMAEKIDSMMITQKRLLSDISHELRSPLARLKVANELLTEKSTEDSKKLIDRINLEADRLNAMIGQVLELSRADLAQNYADKKEIVIFDSIEKIVGDARFEAVSKHCEIVLKADDKSIKFNCFEELFNRAIENIIRNAVKYSPENSKVLVAVKNEAKNIIITISDSGPGVPEEELGRLFEPFYRVNTARDRKTGGAGLGLAIARKAVEAHKGSIFAQISQEGGLEVIVDLPLL